MTSKHTPGPWAVHYSPHGYEVFAKDASRTIVNMPCGVAEYDYVEANARPIAAAPDLLAALKEASDALDFYGDADQPPGSDPILNEALRALSVVDAAIAKAEGGGE